MAADVKRCGSRITEDHGRCLKRNTKQITGNLNESGRGTRTNFRDGSVDAQRTILLNDHIHGVVINTERCSVADMCIAGNAHATALVSGLDFTAFFVPTNLCGGLVQTFVCSDRADREWEKVFVIRFHRVHLAQSDWIHVKHLGQLVYAGFDDGRTLRCAETAKSAGGLLIGVDWITHIAQVRNMIGTSCSADTADSQQFHTEGAVGTGV